MNYETREDANEVREEYRDADGNLVQRREVAEQHHIPNDASSVDDGRTAAQDIVYILYGLLASLLSIRILMTLLSANRLNTFANVVYTLTNPIVAPFRSLFGTNPSIGIAGSHLEIESLMAIMIYGLIAWVVIGLLGVKKHTLSRT